MSKDGGGGDGAAQEGADGKKDDIYETPGNKKLIRLITVIAYMFSVSFVAIVLSAYYLFLWEPPNPRLIRRAHFKADPQIQFLLGDPLIFSNQTKDQLREFHLNNFFKEIRADRKMLKNEQPMIANRVGDDNFKANDLVGNRNQDDAKNRRKLNESLVVLRNSLIEVLRGKANNSGASQDSPEKKKDDLIEKEARSNLTRKFDNSSVDTDRKSVSNDESVIIIVNSTVNNSGTSLTLKSSTISGDEANNDHFTSSENGTTHESFQNILQVEYNSTRDADVKPGNDRNSTNNLKNLKTIDKKSPRSIDVVDKLSRKAAKINKLFGPPDSKKMNKIKVEKSKKVLVNSSTLNSELTNVSVPPQQLNVSSAKLAGIENNSEDLQIEKMTMKTVTLENKNSDPLETLTTQQQKDLLMILIEKTTKREESSTVPSSTVSEDYQTDPILPTKFQPKDTT